MSDIYICTAKNFCNDYLNFKCYGYDNKCECYECIAHEIIIKKEEEKKNNG